MKTEQNIGTLTSRLWQFNLPIIEIQLRFKKPKNLGWNLALWNLLAKPHLNRHVGPGLRPLEEYWWTAPPRERLR